MFEVPFHNQKIGVWCAIAASQIVGPIFLENTIQSGMSVTLLGLFFLTALRKKKRHGYFMQDGATAHTVTYSINILNKVFEDRLISCRLWPARSPDLIPCDFYLGEI
jgi:hypothetical protein